MPRLPTVLVDASLRNAEFSPRKQKNKQESRNIHGYLLQNLYIFGIMQLFSLVFCMDTALRNLLFLYIYNHCFRRWRV